MKKIITIITIITTFLLSISTVYALDINIDKITILDKNDSISIDTITSDNLTITPKITFNEVNDYVIYKVFFKGKDISKYEVLKVSDNNASENIKTTYKYDKTLESPLYITMAYKNGSDKETTINNINIIMELVGKGETEQIVLNSSSDEEQKDVTKSADTGTLSHIITPLILIGISVFLIYYYKKNEDENILMILILFLITIPITVIAYESQKLTLTIKTDKIIVAKSENKASTPTPQVYKVYLYPNGGTGITEGQTFEYTETTLFSKFPNVTKSGCSLGGWNVGSTSGTLYTKDVRPSDDGKKLYAKWNCNNLANMNIKVTKNASYTLDKPINEFLQSKGSSLAEYNAFIKNSVIAAGMSTREGVVAAAVATINYLYDNYDTKLPYYLSGKYHIYGISEKIGTKVSNSTSLYSFDCSGFASWAIKNGGYKLENVEMSREFDERFGSNSCDITNTNCVGKPGDLINARSKHVKMIVAVDEKNKQYYVAEAVSSGLLIQKCGMHEKMNYDDVTTKILLMDNFYNSNNNKQSY